MKVAFLFLVVFSLPLILHVNSKERNFQIGKMKWKYTEKKPKSPEICGECLNLVLCGLLPDTIPPILKEVCVIGCNIVGIEGFIQLIKKADLDPIWMCEEIKMCPVHDCTAAKCGEVKNGMIRPPNPEKYDKEHFIYDLEIFNTSSTGEVILFIQCPAGSEPQTIQTGQMVPELWQPGVYHFAWELELNAAESDLFPGVFKVDFMACEGQCGSRHAHTRLLGRHSGTFNWTWDGK